IASADDFNRPMQDLTTEYCWGYVWGRDGLTHKTRSFLNLAMLCALNRPQELKTHVRGALTNGATREEIREVFMQVAIYCGMLAGLLGRIGAVDILVNNAVVRHFSPVEHFPPERWDEALAVNLSAPFHLIRLALPGMKERRWGRIINMASIYSTRAVADRIDYVTTKTAILGMTRAVAIETTRSGITCNALCPGTLPTPAILDKIAGIATREDCTIDEATSDYLATRQPTGRFVAMEGVGAMAAFLCSPAAQDITGATLPIDGGWSVA